MIGDLKIWEKDDGDNLWMVLEANHNSHLNVVDELSPTTVGTALVTSLRFFSVLISPEEWQEC